MHQKKSKKILIYFFLLLVVGTINNLKINNYKFDKIKNVNVSGLENFENQFLINDIKNLELKNIFNLNEKKIVSVIEKNTLIERYKVQKKYPSTIDIKLLRTEFLAKTFRDGKIYFIGSNGKLIKEKNIYEELPFIFGGPSTDEFLQFKKIIDQSLFSFKSINNLFYFSSKRWDIELKNKIRIKLPKDNTVEILNNAFKVLKDKRFQNIKTIDLRIKNQIILDG